MCVCVCVFLCSFIKRGNALSEIVQRPMLSVQIVPGNTTVTNSMHHNVSFKDEWADMYLKTHSCTCKRVPRPLEPQLPSLKSLEWAGGVGYK